MQINLSQAEQIVRGIVGAGLIIVTGLGAFDGVWQVLAVAFGSAGVFTASAGFCPLYRFMRVGGTAGQPQRALRSIARR